MQTKSHLWFWFGLWSLSLLIGSGIVVLYAWLPADGATGDLASFTPSGFRVQWLLEEQEGGLQAEDVIVSAGGHTVDEWLKGALRGPEWHTGGVVTYKVLRSRQPLTLQIGLAPIAIGVIMDRRTAQLIGALGFFSIGTLVFAKRSQELPARLLMLFCITQALQFLGDAYNFQYATLAWRWPFWLHLVLEHVTYSLSVAAICHFALVFPLAHPLVNRFPRLTPLLVYVSHPVVILGAMAFASSWNAALDVGSRASWVIAMAQIVLAIGAGFRSTRAARDPVARAQIRWIVWVMGVGSAILIPGYVLPLVFGRRPLIPYPATTILTTAIPLSFAIAILRYRLFDIEFIINRSLVYGTLTVILGSLYLLLVTLLTRVVQGILRQENNSLVVFIATLCIALAFAPVRQRVQTWIDRAYYRTKLDYQRLLSEMSERLATSIVLDEVATLLIEELPHRLQITWATMAILDPDGEYFVPVRCGEDHLPQPINLPDLDYLRQLGRPLLRLQLPLHLPKEVEAFINRHSIEVTIPLTVGTELVGLYNLGPKSSGHSYNREELHLLHVTGQQAAVAIQNSRLFQAEREQRQLAEALDEAAAVVSSTLNLDQVLDRILEQVELVVAGDASNIMLVEENCARVVRWRGYERLGVNDRIGFLRVSLSEFPSLAEMMRTGKPVVVADTTADPNWTPLHGWEWLRSFVSAPIRVAGRVVGFLNMDGTRANQFGSADARQLEAFTHHAATAIENARLYERAQQEIIERQRAQERIRTSLDEKETLLKEIHHRVKNNLQVISSLLYLQAKTIEDKRALEMFKDSQSRIKSMALVHERLYQSHDLARIDFAEYVRSLANFLFRSYGINSDAIKLRISVANVSLSIDTAIPCGLIINELVSNSLKHAFPDGREGEVRIELSADRDGKVVLTVSDNGVGSPKDLDFHNTESLGLQLVNALINQLEGTIELDRSQGMAFQMTFIEPKL